MVSSVLGKQFSNIHASLGLVSRALILAISGLDGVGSEQAGVDGRTLRDIDSGIVGAALR